MNHYALLVFWFCLSLPFLIIEASYMLWCIYSARVRIPGCRKLYCPWCWQSLRVGRWYPELWSSTICNHHQQVQLKLLAKRRAARRTAQQSTEVATVPVIQAQAEKVVEVCA